jgi:ketosteroid isomerase-like protein
MATFQHGDAAAVAACSTPEAKLVPPPHPIITGTSGIQAFWHEAMHHRITARALETLDIIARADLVVEVGTYRVTRQSAGGETVTDTGTYTVVWMKEGAQWKMAIDMWNTSPPASDGGRGRVRPRSSPLNHGRACSCLCLVKHHAFGNDLPLAHGGAQGGDRGTRIDKVKEIAEHIAA